MVARRIHRIRRIGRRIHQTALFNVFDVLFDVFNIFDVVASSVSSSWVMPHRYMYDHSESPSDALVDIFDDCGQLDTRMHTWLCCAFCSMHPMHHMCHLTCLILCVPCHVTGLILSDGSSNSSNWLSNLIQSNRLFDALDDVFHEFGCLHKEHFCRPVCPMCPMCRPIYPVAFAITYGNHLTR